MIRPVLTGAPETLPLTLDEAKRHLRVEHGDENDLITSLIGAVTAHLDGWSGILGRCLIAQEWKASYPCFKRVLRLPFPDVTAAAVSYFDAYDEAQAFDASAFRLLEDSAGAYVWLAAGTTYPAVYGRPDAVQVTFTAGYGAAADVPLPIRQAMKLLIGHFYENREAVTAQAMRELPMAVKALIAPYRRQQL